MIIRFHRNFEKQLGRLKKGEWIRLKERFEIFLADEYNPMLNNHPLKGKYSGYRSINIGGDIRAIYKRDGKNIAIFVALGAHTKLYH